MSFITKILLASRLLYPTGRAFRMYEGGELEKLHRALSESENTAYADAFAIKNSLLPPNDNFTAEDAADWERRLGLITNELLDLTTRKLAIERKWNHPGEIKPRQNYRFLERELRSAGFDVYVYENRFPLGGGIFETKTPDEFSLDPYPQVSIQYGTSQYGDIQYGGDYGNKVVNHVNKTLDDSFNIGSNFRSTFFVGGLVEGSWADVDATREDEFRQLILKIKPVQCCGFLLINYV